MNEQLNKFEQETILQAKMDEAIRFNLMTGWMELNASQVKYTGGNEIKIKNISTSGLGDYDRNATDGSAFGLGNTTISYETHKMRYDRGTKFVIDAMDVDESGFMLTAVNVLNEFQKGHVVPEIDKIRLSTCYQKAEEVGFVSNGYDLKPATILNEIKTGIKKIRQSGHQDTLVCHITYDALQCLEENLLNKLTTVTFSVNGIDTRVPSIDGVPLIATTEDRMVTKIDLLSGRNGEGTGCIASSDAEQINFMILSKTAPIAVTKQDLIRIFDPTVNQNANAYSMDYRRYSDLWVKDNKRTAIYACTSPMQKVVATKAKSK